MTALKEDIRSYFAQTFSKHGESAHGVEYNGPQGHYQRIGAVVSEIDATENFSVNDLGCGYGSLLYALYGSGKRNFDYFGYDLVSEMVESGAQNWSERNPRLKFMTGGTEKLQTADYSVASGAFNVKQKTPRPDWQEYVFNSLSGMLAHTHKKLAVNFLTTYSDADHMRDDLYYADPSEMFDFGMKQTGSAAIRHDYGLYDFTLVINKSR